MLRMLMRPTAVALAALLAGCASLKLWEKSFVFDAGPVPVIELRRALVCNTPTEQARVTAFDSAAALRESALGESLQAAELELAEDGSYLVLELGLRRTGGYSFEPRPVAQLDETGLLRVQADWIEPDPDRMRIQILTSLCVLVAVPGQPYNRVELIDTAETLRAFWERPAS